MCLQNMVWSDTWEQGPMLGLLWRLQQLMQRGGELENCERHPHAAHCLQALHRQPRHVGELAVWHLRGQRKTGSEATAPEPIEPACPVSMVCVETSQCQG